jgi:DNA invertase Pin-like site-specific DNA recombinase
MSQKPLTMEQLKQVLQLKKDGVAIREIARRKGISRNAVKRYPGRLQAPPGESDNNQVVISFKTPWHNSPN